jgi:hypothetical protein
VFETGGQRRKCGRETEGLTGRLGNLLRVELHNLYSSDIVRVTRSWQMTSSVHVTKQEMHACDTVFAKPEFKRALRIPACRWHLVLESISRKCEM